MSLSSDGKVTRMMLKTRSGEFDVESIHSLNLRDMDGDRGVWAKGNEAGTTTLEEMGLSDLGCIGECSSLERLDVTGNGLTQLYALASLTNLASLNLSSNKISSLEGLQALENLQTLNVTGNDISSVDGLRYLTGLDKLRELRLRDNVKGLTNPICGRPSYKSEVKAMFPDLLTLDGEHLQGKGSELFKMFEQIDEALKANSLRKLSDSVALAPTNWTPDGFWEQKSTSFEQSNLHDAEEQLKIMLKSCRHLSEQATEKIKEATS